MTQTLVGAFMAALTGVYFLATFAFVAYALTKYNDLKDEIRVLQTRLEATDKWQNLLKVRGQSRIDEDGAGRRDPRA